MKPLKGVFPFSPATIIGVIAGVTMVRTFLENFSNPEPIGGFTSFLLLLNYFLFYTVVVLSLGIFIGILTKQSWMKTISIVALGLPIIILPPIIDITISGGACLAYIASTGPNLLRDFITFFGPLDGCGASIGIRVEIGLIMLGLGRYVFKKTQSWPLAILGAIGAYAIIFFHSAIPGILQTLAGSSENNFFHSFFSNSLLGSVHSFSFVTGGQRFVEQLALFMGRVPWFFIIPLILATAWHESSEKVRAWIGNARLTRVIYYTLFAITGVVIALRIFNIPLPNALPDIFAYLIIITAICCNCWLGVVLNDVADQSIDDISNADRPLSAKTLTLQDMQWSGWIFGTLLVTGGLLINWNVFVMLVMFQISYAVYSLPPLRLKRHYLFSSFLVGCAGLATVLAGYFTVAPNQSFQNLPGGVMLAIFITLAIISNTKDFKDVPGDKAEGIKTLPVVFGTRKAGMILTFGLIGWILFLAFIFHSFWIAILALPWIILDVIIRKRIPEYVRFMIVYAEIIFLLIVIR